WLTTEELFWDAEGRLKTHAPSTYKIPAVNDCPPDLRVQLYDDDNAEDTVFRSKAVGEPPLLLAFSVFFALRDAIASVRGDRGDPARDRGGPAASRGARGCRPLTRRACWNRCSPRRRAAARR